ncbi:DUF6126 family protein [Streptomyces sp. NPDC093225]|uniref:DUF6126 family protein n=1 Tax=Streptomyces sp. NPDC093225 TaxID=3366034 RepID=UPI003824D544
MQFASSKNTADSRRPKAAGPDRERWKEKGVALRALFYVFGTHVFAGFVYLLFYLGQHAHK